MSGVFPMQIKAFFERNWRYGVFFSVALVVLGAVYTWRMTLLPFLLGLLLAYLFTPVVRFIERALPGKGKWQESKRVFAVLCVFIFILSVFALAVFIFVTTLQHSSSDMINNAAEMINTLIARGQQWTQTLRDRFPVAMRAEVDAAVTNLGNSLAGTLSAALSSGGSVASSIMSSLGFIFGFAAVPVFLFYLLKDSEKIQKNIYAELPPGISRHAKNIVNIIECVLGRYIRGELILGTVVGSMSLLGLLIIGVPFAVPLAVFNGFCEMIPTLGPIIGGAVMGLVTLALAPHKAILVVLLAIVVQLLENNLLVPKIQASCLRLHPSLVILLLVLGGYFWGFWGLVLTVPLTATLVDIFTYVRRINREAHAPDSPIPAS